MELSKEQIDIINNKPDRLVAQAELSLVLKPGLARKISYSIYKSVTKSDKTIDNLEAYVTKATNNEIQKVKERVQAKELARTSEVPQKKEPKKGEKSEPKRTDELKSLDQKGSPSKKAAKEVPGQSQPEQRR